MLPTADICDNFPTKVLVAKPIFKDFGGKTAFYGKAITLKTHDDNTKVKKALESNGGNKVLVVDGEGSMNCALLGGNLAALASQNNWSGIIINGCVRDQLEIMVENIGVKALAAHPKKSEKNDGGEYKVTLNFAGISISEGDYIYADEDGIVVTKEKFKF
jgi:regulator of ribonuclease activity A